MSYQTIRLEVREGVAHLTLHRPEAGNAVDLEMTRELADAADRLAADRAARALLLTGSGGTFCVGGDVKKFAAKTEELSSHLRSMATHLHLAVSRLCRLDVPVVAAVQGAAAGAGMSLACGADIVIAAESARFTMAYTKIGLVPDGGSTYFLSRVVGLRRAGELVLTNRVLSAREALEWGIATRVVPDAKLAAEATELAESLAAGPTEALRSAKRLLRDGWTESLETQLERETIGMAEIGRTADAEEGVAAFVEKRPPRFGGR